MIEIFASYTFLLLAAAFLLLYKYSTRNFDYWKKRNVPFIKPIPFFGNLLPLLSMSQPVSDFFWDMYESMDEDYFGIFLFGRPTLIAKSPKLIRSILQKDFAYFENRTVVTNEDDPIMSNVMFFKRNPMWKTVRSKISPAFTSGKLKLMCPLILEQADEMVDYLKTIANIPDVESKDICAKYSVNVIARCAFAIDAHSFKDPNAEFRQLARGLFAFNWNNAFRQFSAWFAPSLVKTFKMQFFNVKIIDSLKRIFADVLRMRKPSTNLKGNDLVDLMIEAKQKSNDIGFTDDEMLAQAIQFFVAGFETVSNTLSFALYEMCINTDLQEKLRVEIMENIRTHDGVTYEGVNEMKYLDMVVSETLRMYPVLPFLDRETKANYKVEGTDFVIQAGTPVYIPLFGLHYDPKFFPNPKKFIPERFENKNEINNDGLYYIPFGEGPRICIGNRFGLTGVKVGLVSILSKFRVERTEKTPVPIKFEAKSFLLQSTVGIPLKFVPL